MNMIKRFMKISLLSLLFIIPLSFNASYIVEGNNEGFDSLESANKICKKLKKCVVLLENDTYINKDVTLDEKVDLSIVDKKFIVNENTKLTIEGDLIISNNAKMIVNGQLEVLGDIDINSLSSLTINGVLSLNRASKITINSGTLDFPNTSKIYADDTNIINILNYGTLKGNRSAFTKTLLTVNNYNSNVLDGIDKALSNYNNYLIYDIENDIYYKSLDEIPSNSNVFMMKSLEINGDATLNKGVKLTIKEGNGLVVNGSLIVNGEIDFEKGYSFIKTYNLLGNGTINLNKANSLDIGYTTYVTILKELSNGITFDASNDYIPKEGDTLFAIGMDAESANKITNNIHLSNKFGSLKINTTISNVKLVNGGKYIGKLFDDSLLNDVATASAKAGDIVKQNDVYYVLLIVLSLTVFIAYLSTRLVILNRKY